MQKGSRRVVYEGVFAGRGARTAFRGLASFLVALLFSFFYPPSAHCQSCNEAALVSPIAGEHHYRIRYSTFGKLAGVDYVEGIFAVVMAADVWNEQSGGAYFTLDGYTNYDDLPDTVAECANFDPPWEDCCEYSIVTVRDDACPGNYGLHVPKCWDGNSDTQSLILVNKNKGDCSEFQWTAGYPSSSDWDIVSAFAHEFGHAASLGHPDSGGAVMASLGAGTARQRELYEYDSVCATTIDGGNDRSLSGYRRHVSSGAVQSEAAFTGAWDVSKAVAGVTKHTGSWDWAAALHGPSNPRWTRKLNTSYTEYTVLDPDVSVLTEATWREDESWDRVFALSEDQYSQGSSWEAVRRVRYSRSDDGFATSTGTYYLRECDAMTGWYQCSAASYINSGKALGVAWDDQNDRTVMAWTTQDRAGYPPSTGEVRIAIGYVSNTTLPVSDSAGVHSSVGPAVVCKEQPLDYNCIVAYVDHDDTYRNVRVRRFEPVYWTNQYRPVFETGYHNVGGPTSSRLAAWHHDGYYWIAFRSSWPGHEVTVYRSVDGTSWSYVGQIGASAIGPSAVSYWTGNNVIVYAR